MIRRVTTTAATQAKLRTGVIPDGRRRSASTHELEGEMGGALTRGPLDRAGAVACVEAQGCASTSASSMLISTRPAPLDIAVDNIVRIMAEPTP